MNCLSENKRSTLQSVAVLLGFLAVLSIVGSVQAQTDGFGEIDRVYIDSVAAGPGRDVPIRFYFQNDEAISALTIPITYDPALLDLQSIDYNGSRADYVGTKLITPENVDSINGHFLVTMIVIFEDPIPPGDGLAFTAVFAVAANALVGTVAVIDSLFYSPGGELILSEASTSGIIRPAFKAGKILIRAETNQPPVLNSISDSYVLEGDSLVLAVTSSDPDGDALILAATSKPDGAMFVDNGDGTGQLIWVPDYVGPNSSEGAPYALSFWVSDGDLSSELEVVVNVVNRNRPPLITLIDSLEVDAGDSLVVLLEATEPDFEQVTWSLDDSGISEAVIIEEPSRLVFAPNLSQSGPFDFNIVAADLHGAADSALLTVIVNRVDTYTLTIDTGSALPGEEIEISISLDNKSPITSFNLLVSFDPTGLIPLQITNQGTRTESFESFSFAYDDGGAPGHTRITGSAFAGSRLDAGVGPIVRLSFRVAGDIGLSGFALPVRFQFVDAPDGDDNTLADSNGVKIAQSEITHRDGRVMVSEMGQVSVGDINLNGVSIEIADAIYFSNYFMDPATYPFNLLQFVNSDVNYDGIGATLSDLVTLINIIVTGVPVGPKLADQVEPTANVFSSADATGNTAFVYETDLTLGAVLLSFQTPKALSWNDLSWSEEQMTLDFHQEDSVVRILLYSLEGKWMPAGRNEFLTIDGLGDFSSEVVEIATADGRQVAASIAEGRAGLPDGFALYQNYPNPFNPETSIKFDLGHRARASLTVYNVLGQEVVQLVSGELEAGSHSITWRGSDSSGRPVGSGIYFYRLETDTGSESRKMILLK